MLKRPNIFFILLVALCVLPSAASAASLARPANNLGLVGYWSFNEATGTIAGDFSGRGNTATFSGTPVWTSGKVSSGLTFTRNTSTAVGFLQVQDSASLKPGTGSMTISFWIKPSVTYADGSNFNIIEKNIDSTSPGWGIYRDSAGNLKARLSYTGAFIDASAGNFATNFATGTWAHVVLVVDRGLNNAYWYKNGAALGSPTDITLLGDMTNTSMLDIGAGNEGVGIDTMGGSLDDVRIYSRALSATEVLKLYQSGSLVTKSANKNGLVGAWNFNENRGIQAGDVSGKNNSGTLLGATLPSWVNGKNGRALSFDGSAGYVDAGNGSDINFGANQDFSISLWVKTTASPGSTKPLAKYNVDSTAVGWGLYQAGGNLYLKVADGASAVYEQNVPTMNDGQWHHIVYSISRSGNCVRYKDGSVIGSTSCSSWAATDFSGNGKNLYFGANNNNNTPASLWSGSLDDVRIYNRALSASDVQSLYKTGGSVANVNTTTGSLNSGLLGYWPFNGADVTDKVYDRSGNNFNGYLLGNNHATSSRKTIGKVGQGFSFGAQNTGGIDLGNSSSLVPNRFTISAWIITATSTYAYNYIYSNDRDCCGTYNGIGFGYGMLGAGKLVGMIWNSSQYSISSNASIATSTWTHVAYSYDGANMRLYINGVLDKAQAQTIDPGTPASFNTYLGSMGQSNGTQYTFDGKLDEIRLYSRALSAAEIKQLYNAGR